MVRHRIFHLSKPLKEFWKYSLTTWLLPLPQITNCCNDGESKLTQSYCSRTRSYCPQLLLCGRRSLWKAMRGCCWFQLYSVVRRLWQNWRPRPYHQIAVSSLLTWKLVSNSTCLCTCRVPVCVLTYVLTFILTCVYACIYTCIPFYIVTCILTMLCTYVICTYAICTYVIC